MPTAAAAHSTPQPRPNCWPGHTPAMWPTLCKHSFPQAHSQLSTARPPHQRALGLEWGITACPSGWPVQWGLLLLCFETFMAFFFYPRFDSELILGSESNILFKNVSKIYNLYIFFIYLINLYLYICHLSSCFPNFRQFLLTYSVIKLGLYITLEGSKSTFVPIYEFNKNRK